MLDNQPYLKSAMNFPMDSDKYAESSLGYLNQRDTFGCFKHHLNATILWILPPKLVNICQSLMISIFGDGQKAKTD